MSNKTSESCFAKRLWIVIAAVLMILAVLAGIFFFSRSKERNPSFFGSELNIKEFTPQVVFEGLQVTSMGDYSGLFLEDGSDQVVSSVMMIVLENVSDKDLQLARIRVLYPDFVAEYEATNIPAGRSVTLLEKNRRKYSDDNFIKFSAENVVFFSEGMEVMEDTFAVTPGEGFLQIKNISDKDIDGTTIVYYKNKAGDTLYGGITYRVKIEEQIPAGESVKVLTNHFTGKNTEIVQIVNVT